MADPICLFGSFSSPSSPGGDIIASINGITGKLFPDNDRGRHDDLRQSVMDRILTPLGSQPWRPLYGSRAYRTNIVGVQDAANSINTILLTGPWRDPRITRVRYSREGTHLNVKVTGRIASLDLVL